MKKGTSKAEKNPSTTKKTKVKEEQKDNLKEAKKVETNKIVKETKNKVDDVVEDKKDVKSEDTVKTGLSEEAKENNEKLRESIAKLTGRDIKEIEKRIQKEIKDEMNKKNSKTDKAKGNVTEEVKEDIKEEPKAEPVENEKNEGMVEEVKPEKEATKKEKKSNSNKKVKTKKIEPEIEEIPDLEEQEDIKEPEEIIINEPKSKKKTKTVESKLQEQLAEEVKNNYKKRRRIKIVIIAIVLILILVIVGVLIIRNFKTTTQNVGFYQWTSGQKVQYDASITTARKNKLTDFKPTDENIVLDSTPVYFANEKNKVILPKEMEIVYPNDNGAMYKVDALSEVTKESDGTYLTSNEENKMENAFLFDGKDLYFFFDTTRITVNGTNYEVSPLSYVVVKYRQSVEIYNYEKDDYQVINTTDTHNVKLTTNSYAVDMTTDTLQTLSKEQALVKDFSKLQNLEEK